SRKPRDGRSLEEIGLYHPIEVPEKQLVIDEARAKEWLAKGAQPTDTVKSLLNSKGIHVK
ncbi:MAG TPA: 30S ribosomal protein S16, partial [Rectinemataceae bacterium]|nr:30S ribosomal protein S16 [Rectinemataceae bacterium]